MTDPDQRRREALELLNTMFASGDTGVELTADRFKVTAAEKVSTGQYENYNPTISIEGSVSPTPLDDDARAELKERLLQLHGDMQAVLAKAAGNRVAEPEWRSWTVTDEDNDE